MLVKSIWEENVEVYLDLLDKEISKGGRKETRKKEQINLYCEQYNGYQIEYSFSLDQRVCLEI